MTVAGPVEPLPREEAEAYFRTRPLGSRLGAWASRQSTVVPDREVLDRAFAEAESTYGDDPPLPPWWGGYLLRPDARRALAEPPEPPARPLPLRPRPGWRLGAGASGALTEPRNARNAPLNSSGFSAQATCPAPG